MGPEIDQQLGGQRPHLCPLCLGPGRACNGRQITHRWGCPGWSPLGEEAAAHRAQIQDRHNSRWAVLWVLSLEGDCAPGSAVAQRRAQTRIQPESCEQDGVLGLREWQLCPHAERLTCERGTSPLGGGPSVSVSSHPVMLLGSALTSPLSDTCWGLPCT